MENAKPNVRKRSPRYPSHALDEALAYVSRIYEGVHRSAIDSDTAYKLMGFAGKSGASATALGSVRQFGLIEGLGDNTRVSDLALSILEPESDSEKVVSMEKAAFEPAVFQSVRERFGGKVPPADEPIRAYLIRELGFSKSGVDDCIAALRKTISLLPQIIGGSTLDQTIQHGDTITESAIFEASDHPLDSAPSRSQTQIFRLPISKECTAEISFIGKLDTAAIERLIQHVSLMKEVWAES